MICPNCGNQIPTWAHGTCYNCVRMAKEQERYGRGRPKGVRKRWRSSTERPRPQFFSATAIEQRRQRQGINYLLEDIYGYGRLLSNILRDAGLKQEQIAHIRRFKLDLFLANLLRQWYEWFQCALPDGCCLVLVRLYGLDGQPHATVKDLGVEYGYPHRQVEQSLKSALECLRSRPHKQALERIVVDVAGQMLLQTQPPVLDH